MPKKKAPDPKEKSQRKRFIEFAKEHGADEDDEALERALKKVAKQPQKDADDNC